MDDLLKEAIADAKAVRETALENAKIALEEAFTPRLKSMLSQKIQNEMEGEEEAGEEEEEEAPAEAHEPEHDEEEEAEPEMEEGEEEEYSDEPADGEAADMEEQEEEEEEDELDLEAILRELEEEAEEDEEDEEVEEEYEMSTGDGHDEKGKPADEADLAEDLEDSSEIGAGDNKVDADSADSSDIGQGSEEPADADSPPAGKENDDDEVVDDLQEIDLKEVIKALEEEEDEEEEVEEISKYKTEIAEHRNVIKYLRGKLNEVNLLNAKLLFTNKLFRSFGLTNEQKMKVVETFDRAKNLREVKLVFSTLAESFGGSGKGKIKESKGSSSKPVASTEPKSKEVITEGSELKTRFKKLANII